VNAARFKEFETLPTTRLVSGQPIARASRAAENTPAEVKAREVPLDKFDVTAQRMAEDSDSQGENNKGSSEDDERMRPNPTKGKKPKKPKVPAGRPTRSRARQGEAGSSKAGASKRRSVSSTSGSQSSGSYLSKPSHNSGSGSGTGGSSTGPSSSSSSSRDSDSSSDQERASRKKALEQQTALSKVAETRRQGKTVEQHNSFKQAIQKNKKKEEGLVGGVQRAIVSAKSVRRKANTQVDNDQPPAKRANKCNAKKADALRKDIFSEH
jgi:hypothetical protein